MKRLSIILCTLLFIAGYANATMQYRLSFDTTKHYINVELSMDSLPSGQLTMVLPMWAPGYYNLAYYPKNITDFRPVGSDGTLLKWTKKDFTRWIVDKQDTKFHNKLIYYIL